MTLIWSWQAVADLAKLRRYIEEMESQRGLEGGNTDP